MIINKKIKRTMKESKSQYVGSFILIIISCLLYTMFNQLTSNMVTSLAAFKDDYVQEDANFIADQKILKLQPLESKFNMLIEETGSVDYAVSDTKTLRIFSENAKVDKPAIIKGDKPGEHNIVIDPAYAAANQITIGDSITIYDKEFIVSGFMSLPNYIYPIKQESDLFNDANSFGVAVMSKADFMELGQNSTSYAIKFMEDNNKTLSVRITEFKDYLKESGILVMKWTNIDENPRVSFVTAKIDGIKSISSTLPVFILLLTCILTGIVMWRLLKREFVSIGTLYAIGYRKWEIRKHYLIYPFVISVTGGVIGTILGFFTLRPMLNFMISYFNFPVHSVRFDIKYSLISVLLPVIFLGVCGYFVVNRALKLSPLALMRGGEEKRKVSFIERKLKLDQFKFVTKFKIREQMRSVPRSIFLLFGVIIATMLLLMGFAMKSSLDYLLKDSYEDTYKYEYQYFFKTLEEEANTEGEAFSVSSFLLDGEGKTGFAVYGVDSDSKYLTLKDKSGKALSTNQIIATKPLADKYKLKAGDRIKVINKNDSREYSITIDRIADTYVGEYIYMPIDQFNAMLLYPTGSYMGLWSDKALKLEESKLFSTATIDYFKDGFATITGPLESYVAIISILAFIIGLIVIYVVTSLIIEENKENISLMKVLGYKKKEVYSLILNSSSFVVILGYILGVPLLLASIKALFVSVTDSMNLAFPVKIDYYFIAVGFVIILLIYEISKALSKKKVNRIAMTEALKSRME